ncbi:MAG TPA: glycosyltransferase [Micromonosporaceae bacterium]
MTTFAWLLAAMVGLLTMHTAVNTWLLRRLPVPPPPVTDPVSVLLPVRDEAARLRPCLESLLAQRGLSQYEIIVLDDGSTDGTGELVRRIAAGDPRLRLVVGAPLPSGWLGKAYACHQLAQQATGRVLAFVDADVVLAPDAVAAAAHGLLRDGFDLLSAYPGIDTSSIGERLIQPLLQWTWLTFLPLRAMERSPRPSLAAAGGQFLLLSRTGYERAGGHAAVRDRVLEDIELARAVKCTGGRIAIADASPVARCRMYRSWSELTQGYTKSLWASFRSPVAAGATLAALLALYVVPAVVAVVGLMFAVWAWLLAGLCGYLLGVAGRTLSAAATGGRSWPDALAHPVSMIALAWLVVRSYRLRRRGQLAWKGRDLASG